MLAIFAAVILNECLILFSLIMKLRDLSITKRFLNDFKKEYGHLKIGKRMHYDLDWFDDGDYSIVIRTGVLVIDSDLLTKFTCFFNNRNFSWFIGVGLTELTFHVQ